MENTTELIPTRAITFSTTWNLMWDVPIEVRRIIFYHSLS